MEALVNFKKERQRSLKEKTIQKVHKNAGCENFEKNKKSTHRRIFLYWIQYVQSTNVETKILFLLQYLKIFFSMIWQHHIMITG